MQQTQKSQGRGAPGRSELWVKYMRILLVILNGFVLGLGIAALAIGAWSLSGDYGADNIEEIMDTDLFTAVSVLLVVGGSIVIITAIVGIVGAILGSKLVLSVYFAIMILFAVVFVVGAIVGFFFLDEVEDSLADSMKETLLGNYGVNLTTSERNKEVTTVWNDIQRDLKCCGVRGDVKGSESWFLWQSSRWFDEEGSAHPNPNNHVYVPTSCCNTAFSFDDCQMINADTSKPPQTSQASVTQENSALFPDGCLDKLEDKIMDHIVGIVVVAILIFILIIVCAVVALLVCMEAGKIGHVV